MTQDAALIQRMKSALDEEPWQPRMSGRVTHVTGTIIRAWMPAAQVGQLCDLRDMDARPGSGTAGAEGSGLAEVVGLFPGGAMLAPLGVTQGLGGSTAVRASGRLHTVPVGPGLLGRVLDGLGAPMDEAALGPLEVAARYPVLADAPDPMSRIVIDQPLPTGLRVIDGLLTCGEGQRIGIFAAAGGGKSTLLAMLARHTAADVIVVALIGERGREVREFIERDLDPVSRKRCVIVCATSDRSAMERSKAAFVATAIAEYFRDQGQKVLLLMDSVTRFARALREIGLAAGEPPTRRAFPPSVFATLPRLVERAGMNARGSITAFYTVLVEGDDMTEPVADEVRSLLDGHIILSRKLGEANHYPAIDVLASISRVMGAVVSSAHLAAAGRVRALMAAYNDVEFLVRIGEYKPGSDKLADEAIAKRDAINAFVRQAAQDSSSFAQTQALLERIARG